VCAMRPGSVRRRGRWGRGIQGACGFDYWGKVVYTESGIAKYHERDLTIMAEAEAMTRTWARPGAGRLTYPILEAPGSHG
jgi:hypothetical protein